MAAQPGLEASPDRKTAVGRAAPVDVARWAVTLGGAGVDWSTVRRLGVVVRLAGLDTVAGLGGAVVDGPDAGREAVRTVFAELAGLAGSEAAADALERVADTLRRLSISTRAEGDT
ncbi:hypothetical protein [Agromyces italicus]|uniref:hypothetical protein n=1 Tax=Agromyces italicus TaxID=279572 RepID=UPI000419BD17|nr:hypothetical protein [Agromyces italicus]